MAKDIARNFNAELNLLMVIPLFYPMSETSIYAGAMNNYYEIIKILKTKGSVEIKKAAQKCQESGVKTSYKVIERDVSYTILKHAKKHRLDLIIMGSRRMQGLGAIKRLGSTARYISEHATCPVTIVH